ncbi:hypothetical protein BSAF29S_06730 [Bacillus safensis subsp. safensis]
MHIVGPTGAAKTPLAPEEFEFFKLEKVRKNYCAMVG